VLLLVTVLTVVSYGLVVALDIDVGFTYLLAGSVGLYLLVIGMGTIAFGIGAATGRRTMALGTAAAVAVVAFILNAIGPTIPAGWMTAVSPFSWYLENEPLANGFDVPRLLLLAAVPIVFAVVGLARFTRRDLMV
jgi:ABC-2 type transport system permease protein